MIYGTPDVRSGQRSEVRYRCEDLCFLPASFTMTDRQWPVRSMRV